MMIENIMLIHAGTIFVRSYEPCIIVEWPIRLGPIGPVQSKIAPPDPECLLDLSSEQTSHQDVLWTGKGFVIKFISYGR